jgi:hypothetical protein
MRTGTAHLPPTSEQRPTTERTPTAPSPTTALVPLQPPGRLTRKARHYADQIVQLRAQGHTLEAIRQALLAVGVQVDISTVRREALRPSSSAPSLASPPPAPSAPSPAPAAGAGPPAALASSGAATAAHSPLPGVSGPTSAKDRAEAFVRSKSDNPLVRAKEQPS